MESPVPVSGAGLFCLEDIIGSVLIEVMMILRERFNSHVASIFSMRRELAIYTILSLDNVVCS